MKASQFSYGSDPSGLICGYLFGREPQALSIDSQEAIAWMAQNTQRLAAQSEEQPSPEFIWLHVNLSHAAGEKWLLENANLPEEYFEALHEGLHSTRIENANGTLIAVVNDVLYDFSFEPSDISTLWVSVDAGVVVSARRQPLQSIDRLRDAVRKGESIRSSVELLIHLLHDQADVLVKIVRDVTRRVDSIEDNLLAEKINNKRANLGGLRRILVRLQRLLAPEPASLFRLLQKPPQWIHELDVQELGQSTEEFSVVLSDMASLQERIKLLQEEVAARVNEENNRSLYLLTIFTVMALPINVIAGLFGMNVGGIPMASADDGFWVVVGIVATFVVACWFVFRRQRDDR